MLFIHLKNVGKCFVKNKTAANPELLSAAVQRNKIQRKNLRTRALRRYLIDQILPVRNTTEALLLGVLKCRREMLLLALPENL
jgi:hypothetical protein